MIGYPYIQALFQTILNGSKVIKGNFYVCPKWGSELSNPNIDEALAIGQARATKFPAAMLMPPPKQGNFQYQGMDKGSGTSLYDLYTIQILFVAGAGNTGQNQVMQPNAISGTTHTIPDTWHDMDRCAQDFLIKLQETVAPLAGNVIVWDKEDSIPRIKLVTDLGGDHVSGVLLSFKLAMFSGCVVEDYAATPTPAPAYTDTHPIHGM